MRRVQIVHWKPDEAGPLLEACRAGGLEAVCNPDTHGPAICKAIREGRPDAVVVDLSRLPSHGKELAAWVCERKIPVVFVNGEPEKVEKIRKNFPDAGFAVTATMVKALGGARASARPKPPEKSTAEKLGVKPGATVGVMDAPRDYLTALGDLPADVEVIEDPASVQDIMLWFVRDVEALDRALRKARGKAWIVWRKGSKNGLTPVSIRAAAAERGLVDYKICAVDARWSAMLFGRKRG